MIGLHSSCFFRGFHTLLLRRAAAIVVGAVGVLLMSPALKAEVPTSDRKLEFDVASIRENKTGEPPYSNFPMVESLIEQDHSARAIWEWVGRLDLIPY